MTNLWQAKELGLLHVCFSSDIKVSSCWHLPKSSKLLMIHREPKMHLPLLLRLWKLVASFYLLQGFLKDFLQESFLFNKRGFTGHFLRIHVLKTIWSGPDQDELLTSNCSDQSMGDESFFIQGSELVNRIYLPLSALVHFPALRDMHYAQASLIHDSAVASSMSERKSARAWDQFLHLWRTR